MVRRPSFRCPSVHHFQRSSSPKPLGQSKPNFVWSLSWIGEWKINRRGLGHMTKMATIPIYGKNPSKIFFSRTKGPMTLWLGRKHWGLGPIIVCSNDEARLTLIYFTARSNLVSYAFIWGKLSESNLMEETYSKWPMTKGLCLYKILTPGLYICIKTWKIMYKIRLQSNFFLNLQQTGKVTKLFCWHQDFVFKGLSAPAPGLYTCGKT